MLTFRSSRRLTPFPALAAAALAAALVVAGCGGSSNSGDANPASVVPATAPLYLEATIRPQGDQKTAIEGIIKKLGGVENPGEQIQKLIDNASKKSGDKLDYSKDIEPWLGDRLAIAAPSLRGSGSNQDVAVIIATKDAGKAQDAIDKDKQSGATDQEYNGVKYTLNGDTAEGIVSDFVVIGSEKGFKAIVDGSKGDSLADSDAYKNSAAAGGGDQLGLIYLNTRRFIDDLSASGQLSAAQVDQFKQLAGTQGTAPVVGSLSAQTDQITLALTGPAAEAANVTSQSSVLPALPAATWLALGVPKVGASISGQIAKTGGAASAIESFGNQIKAQTGIDLQRDVFDVLGDMAFFASGTTVESLNAGAIFDTSSQADGARLVRKLAPLVSRAGASSGTKVAVVAGGFSVTSPRLPGKVVVVQRGNKMAIVYGGVDRALDSGQTLADNPDFRDAARAIGAPVTFFLSFGALSAIGEATAGSNPQFSQAKATLDKLNWLSFGGKADGKTQVAKIILKLK